MSFSPFQTKVPKYRPSLSIEEILATIDALNFHIASGHANQATRQAIHTLNLFAYKQSLGGIVPTNGNAPVIQARPVPSVKLPVPSLATMNESPEQKQVREAKELAELNDKLMAELGQSAAPATNTLESLDSLDSLDSFNPEEL